MTTIAWDGKTLAADKLGNSSGLKYKVTKIFRIDQNHYKGSLVGFSGTYPASMALLHWLRTSPNEEDLYPSIQANEDKNTYALLITPDKRILKWETGSFPFEIENDKIAIGAGRDFAIAAMHCGKTAREAVEIANIFSTNCGMGIDTLEHYGQPAKEF
jgi:ATP-dependent protease HslVU (ClpYQ) peptidase subunit